SSAPGFPCPRPVLPAPAQTSTILREVSPLAAREKQAWGLRAAHTERLRAAPAPRAGIAADQDRRQATGASDRAGAAPPADRQGRAVRGRAAPAWRAVRRASPIPRHANYLHGRGVPGGTLRGGRECRNQRAC